MVAAEKPPAAEKLKGSRFTAPALGAFLIAALLNPSASVSLAVAKSTAAVFSFSAFMTLFIVS
jgi:hypothetical protein